MSEKFNYEIRPCVQEDGMVAECEEGDADFWGVYERPEKPDNHGARLAVWVADFARKEDAQAFVGLF